MARGFSLIVVLIILVIVSMLGVAASQLVLQSERSARFDRDWQVAFQAAEAALMDAEFVALDSLDEAEASERGFALDELLPPQGEDVAALRDQMVQKLPQRQ